MKEKILELIAQGNSKSEVAKILDIAKSTVTYYCNDEYRQATYIKSQKQRKDNSLIKRTTAYKGRSKIVDSTKDFQRREGPGNRMSPKATFNFTYKDVLAKFGEDTICYLSGEKVNLMKDRHYNLDHIVPWGKGGDNSLENLGITHKVANMMKQDLSVEELLDWCKRLLQHNGYKVDKEN